MKIHILWTNPTKMIYISNMDLKFGFGLPQDQSDSAKGVVKTAHRTTLIMPAVAEEWLDRIIQAWIPTMQNIHYECCVDVHNILPTQSGLVEHGIWLLLMGVFIASVQQKYVCRVEQQSMGLPLKGNCNCCRFSCAT